MATSKCTKSGVVHLLPRQILFDEAQVVEVGHVVAPGVHRGVLDSLWNNDDAAFFQKIAVAKDMVFEAYSDLSPEAAKPHRLFECTQENRAAGADGRQVNPVLIVATIHLHKSFELIPLQDESIQLGSFSEKEFDDGCIPGWENHV